MLVVDGNEVYELDADCMRQSRWAMPKPSEKKQITGLEPETGVRPPNQLTGEGICVALLDSGVYPHPDFKDRIAVFVDMTSKRQTPYDPNGHGTHVAGILAGNGAMSRGQIRGIAPGVTLAVIKVLDEKGHGKLSHMLRGIQWILDHRRQYGIRIVNISAGASVKKKKFSPRLETDRRETWRAATLNFPRGKSAQEIREEGLLMEGVNRLWDAGLVVCIAAGNEGGDVSTVTTPGINRRAITVGSYDDEHMWDGQGRHFRNYSGRGPTESCICKPEIVAPGTNIIAANAMRSTLDKPYAIKSGTSMSTPIVSGAIALLLEAHPDMANWEVKLRLRQRAQDLGMEANHQGWGALNVEALLAEQWNDSTALRK